MGNITIKLNLAGLVHAVQNKKTKSGEAIECLVIPIDKNKLYRGEKGMYLDVTGFEIKNPAEGQKDTHILKQSFSKEYYDSLTDEQKKALPILGNAIAWGTYKPKEAAVQPTIDEDDDLPF